MKHVGEFAHPVRVIEHCLIPLPDDTQLAARIWLPEGAEESPVPAIFEYIPYRKRDLTRHRDEITHRYFAGHGYACVRVDLRGSGESDGILIDQYRQQELDDAVTAIRWMADQSWCDGKVGMMGISWGGFNSLQVAAMDPPELKAIISACSTDDLYVDNMHYMGGCLLGDNLSESTTMFSINSCPPDPLLVGERWRAMWLERLEHSGLWLDTWLRHQHRDDYWKHGSVCEDYSQISCPVMTVGGWADGYTNAVFRLLARLQVPRLGLVGPWGHKYPHLGKPGPAIGFLQEALRWWDHWLKGHDRGIMNEPMLRSWMQDSVPPTTYSHEHPGRWVGESSWPSANVSVLPLSLAPGRLDINYMQAPDEELSIQSPLSVGLFAGKWCSYTAAPDLPHDQREEDGGSLVFESEPLQTRLEILGAPTVELEFALDKPVGMIAARLSDVAADGKATRVTYGLFNLCYAESQEEQLAAIPEDELAERLLSSDAHMRYDSPTRLLAGKRYRVRVRMNNIGQVFPAGHRVRLSLSTSYWPLAWAPPEPVRLSIFTGASCLLLPQRSIGDSDTAITFEEPEGAQAPADEVIETAHHNWLVHRDLARDLSSLEVIKDEGTRRIEDIDLAITNRTWEDYTYQGDDFGSLQGETRTERRFSRGDWAVTTTTRTLLSCDRTHFYIHAVLDAFEGKKRVFSRNWDRVIPRDYL